MKKLYFAGIILILILLQAPSCVTAPASLIMSETIQYGETIRCIHYDDSSFKKSANSAGQVEPSQKGTVGGIVPHHLLAEKMIASFFKALSSLEPEVVVLIGPNHERIGEKKLHTTSSSWETPYGILEADKDLTGWLVNEFDAGTGVKLFEDEHSISALIPYVKYYMPGSKIVPVLLHGNFGLENSVELGCAMEEKLRDNSHLVIASVDFSHYLSVNEADIIDEITLEAIADRDIHAINRMGNDNLDSPPSIITLLTVVDKAGANEISVTGHDNSARIAGGGMDYTTSYFTMLFYR